MIKTVSSLLLAFSLLAVPFAGAQEMNSLMFRTGVQKELG